MASIYAPSHDPHHKKNNGDCNKKITVVGQLFPHLNRKGVTGTWMVNISVVIRDGMLI
jgi:hypothetical protein